MPICLPLYDKIFNFVFDKCIIPEIWSNGIINSIYKNKGDPKDPDSYLGISLYPVKEWFILRYSIID